MIKELSRYIKTKSMKLKCKKCNGLGVVFVKKYKYSHECRTCDGAKRLQGTAYVISKNIPIPNSLAKYFSKLRNKAFSDKASAIEALSKTCIAASKAI